MFRRGTFAAAVLIALTGSIPSALGGGLLPTSAPPLDPERSAAVVIRDAGPPLSERAYAVGGRFVGDLDGDGLDDFVLQAGIDNRLHVFFGDAAWADGDGAGGALALAPGGDTVLELPQGCRRNDDRVHFAPLGDLNADGRVDLGVGCLNHVSTLDGEYIEGAVALYLGRSTWPEVVAAPSALVFGSPPVIPGRGGISGEKLGVDVAGVGDLDGDGFDDFAATAEPWTPPEQGLEQPVVLIFPGGPNPTTLERGDDARWRIVGGPALRCFAPLDVAALGDIDDRGKPDFAVACPEQPPLVDPGNPEHVPNSIDIAYSVFRGEVLDALGPGEHSYDARSFGVLSGAQVGARAATRSAVGDLDGDGVDDFGFTMTLPTSGDVGVRFLQGADRSWDDVGPLTPWAPYILDGPFEDPAVLDFAAVSDLTGDGRRDVWLRRDVGAAARIGLIPQVDPSQWADPDLPPDVVRFTAPGGVVVTDPARFGLGGVGDADGDGTPDLLITSGWADATGCDPAACGGAWLILCRDADGDGWGACGGDCDDSDAGIAPGLPEVCDDVDHDCDGTDGRVDGDGDGVLGCEGDCDDADDTVNPGAVETCDDTEDVDCDGLAPGADQDGDGAPNCEDCQPWLDSMTPGAEELCDGLDNDCDGRIDRDETDVDRDGNPACEGAAGPESTDCADDDARVGPHRHEDCTNEVDDDCDEIVDVEADADGDGVTTCEGDCDDSDPSVFPGASEFPPGAEAGACDGIDNDCNGLVDDARDRDGDGRNPCSGDCDEDDPAVHAGAVGSCSGEDHDCDGSPDILDGDGDGWSACAGDCDDADPSAFPGAPEYCDRIDTDCDGDADSPFDEDGDGWPRCHGDCDDGNAQRSPLPVEPQCDDGGDQDCDLLADADDPDCARAAIPPDPEARPYGLACSGCSGSVVAGSPEDASPPVPLAALLLVLAVHRRRRRRSPRAPRTIAVAVVVAVAVAVAGGVSVLAPPSAEAARKQEPGVVIYMAGQPDIRSQVEAREAATEIDAADILHTSEFLSNTRDNVVALGVRDARTCLGGSGPDLRSVAGRVLDLLIDLDHGGADRLIASTLEDLTCLKEPLPRRLLPDLLFYRGVAHHALGRGAEAEDDFRRLLAVQPDYPGDCNFPPEVGALLEQVRASLASVVPVEGWVYAPGTKVALNGLDAVDRAGRAELRPGVHVLQLTRGRTTFTVEVIVAEGDRPVVLLAADRVRALRDAGVVASARAFAAATLRRSLADARADLAALVDLEVQSGVLWMYRGTTDRFSFEGDLEIGGRRAGAQARRGAGAPGPAASGGGATRPGGGAARSGGGAARSTTRAPAAAREDSLRLRVGGSFAYLHPFTYARIPIDAGVRLVRGLHLDIGFAASFTPTDTYGTVWLPELEIGASYRFELPDVQPRVGAAALISVDSADGTVGARPGFLVRAGADFTPPARPLFFGADVQVGMSGPTFRFAVTGGVGVRF